MDLAGLDVGFSTTRRSSGVARFRHEKLRQLRQRFLAGERVAGRQCVERKENPVLAALDALRDQPVKRGALQ